MIAMYIYSINNFLFSQINYNIRFFNLHKSVIINILFNEPT